jgi:outer membrane protein assembly factor BamB
MAYALSSEVLECVDLATRERRWRAGSRFGHGQILIVGDRILAHTEDGELVLVEANRNAYSELGRIKTIDGVCWNTLALFGDRLLVRSDREAACFVLPTRLTNQTRNTNQTIVDDRLSAHSVAEQELQ